MTLESAVYLIPVTLGDTPIEQVLPSHNREVIIGIKHFIVENIRSARRFLKKVEQSINIDELGWVEAVSRQVMFNLANGKKIEVRDTFNNIALKL